MHEHKTNPACQYTAIASWTCHVPYRDFAPCIEIPLHTSCILMNFKLLTGHESRTRITSNSKYTEGRGWEGGGGGERNTLLRFEVTCPRENVYRNMYS